MLKIQCGVVAVVFTLIPSILPAQNFGGNPSSIKWNQVNTKTARVIFPKGLDSQANRIHNILQLLDSTTIKSIGGEHRKWNIVLQNQNTISNAYVRMAPILSELNMVPSPDNFSTGSIRWDDNLIIHEDRHMQQLSNFDHGLTRIFSFVLGQEGQLLANGITIPNYFFEGDAVFQETLVSAQGRGRMPNFYNGFKSLWLGNKKYSWMKLRSGSYKHFTPDHYELGYQLIGYGTEKYGADFWRKVTHDAVRFKGLFYSFNNAIRKYSGRTYPQFREDAMQYFKERALVPPAKTESLQYISAVKPNNVVDHLFPRYISNDSILLVKRSYRQLAAFYLLADGKQKKIRVRDMILDDYYSYEKGKIVYAGYQSDPRWGNRNYSIIKLLDVKTGKQMQLSKRSRYFSPLLNPFADELLVVNVSPDGSNGLRRLDVTTGNILASIPNPQNYFFTQSAYINSNNVVSAVRHPNGKMALVKVDLTTGASDEISPFSFNLVGYPVVKDRLVYFNAMHENADKIFVVNLDDKKIYRLTDNVNGIYHPAVNDKNELLFDAFTADGSRLAKMSIPQNLEEISKDEFIKTTDLYTPNALKGEGAGILYAVTTTDHPVTRYKKTFKLFNFHSRRPVVNDPEYGYSFYSDNVLSNFSNSLTYTYNRNERSHVIGFNAIYAGWFPVLSLGTEGSFHRIIDTAIGKPFQFNSATLKAAVSLPLNFTGGRTNKYLNTGVGYNIEQFYYRGIGKNIFNNKAFHYANAFLNFTHTSRQARQQVNPRWAQAINTNYRHAFDTRESRKFVANSSFYFPGIFPTHSFVINASFQKRDSLPDIFSNSFSYSRGYEALSTRRMYKWGANYQLPLFYPDWGFGNIIFFQRIRGNAFYDHTQAKARVNGSLTEIKSRSTGAEFFFDTKIWNALPLSFGFRYARLLDTDLLNPTAKNRWEFIVPIGLIPD